jgi:4-hydroxymandelate oxidase
MAFQPLAHQDGELATARGGSIAGIGMVLSTMATYSIKDVAAKSYENTPASPQWFQL